MTLLNHYFGSKASLLQAVIDNHHAICKDRMVALRAIVIGDDVWLGSGVIVLPGVTIGDRSTVGAGAVVTDDVPPDSLALGAPAKVVRRLD